MVEIHIELSKDQVPDPKLEPPRENVDCYRAIALPVVEGTQNEILESVRRVKLERGLCRLGKELVGSEGVGGTRRPALHTEPPVRGLVRLDGADLESMCMLSDSYNRAKSIWSVLHQLYAKKENPYSREGAFVSLTVLICGITIQ